MASATTTTTTTTTKQLHDTNSKDFIITILSPDQQLRLQAARDYAALITAQFQKKLSQPNSTTSSIHSQQGSLIISPVPSKDSPTPIINNKDHTLFKEVVGSPLSKNINGTSSSPTTSKPQLSPLRRTWVRSISRDRGRSPSLRRRSSPLGRSSRRYSRSPPPPHHHHHPRSPPRRRYSSRGRYSPQRSRSPIRRISRSPIRRISRSPIRRTSRSPIRRRPSFSPPRRYPVPDRKPAALVTPVINRTINRIYVGNIAPTLSEQSVRAVFSRFGYIKELSMTRDTDLNTHKGWCFVEFDAPEAAMSSIQLMNGMELDGRVLKVNHTNAYNDAIWRHFPLKVPSRLYYANVHPLLTEEDMRDLFEPFGKIPDILVFRHKGYGYVEYESEQAMTNAVKYLNSLPYNNAPGELLMVLPTLVGGPFPEGMRALDRFPRPRTVPHPLPSGPKPVLPRIVPEPPSQVLVLKNMVAPGDVDEYLKDDVLEECGKYGVPKQVVVHVRSEMANATDESGVRVFVVFESVADRLAVEKVMHNRFFGGRVVTALEFPQSKFDAKEYDS